MLLPSQKSSSSYSHFKNCLRHQSVTPPVSYATIRIPCGVSPPKINPGSPACPEGYDFASSRSENGSVISFAHHDQCFGIGYGSVRGNFGSVRALFLSFQFRTNKIESSSCEKKKKEKKKKKPCGWRFNISNDYEVFRGLGPGACLSKVPIAFRAQKPGVIGSC